MSNIEQRNNEIVQGLQEDGYGVWLDRLPGPHPNITMRVPPRQTSRPRLRRTPRCSYCRCEGHNVLACNPPEKEVALDMVDQWTDIFDGPYANMSRMELKRNIKHYLKNLVRDEPDEHLWMLYYVVLGIRNPLSALYGTSREIRKITDQVFNIRSHKIYTSGTVLQQERFQRELNEEMVLRARNSERHSRLTEIMNLHNQEMNFHNQIYQVENSALFIQNEFERERRLETLRNGLVSTQAHYRVAVEAYQTMFEDNPEDVLVEQMQRYQANIHFQGPINFNFIPSYIQPTLNVVNVEKQVLLPEEKEGWTEIECPVCYETIEGENICLTNCSHKFCTTCISQVVKMNGQKKCPCCRATISKLVNKVVE
jgi:hypothetical protein